MDELQNLKVHLSHCNFGEHEHGCKYGKEDCPALTESWSWFGRALHRQLPFNHRIMIARYEARAEAFLDMGKIFQETAMKEDHPPYIKWYFKISEILKNKSTDIRNELEKYKNTIKEPNGNF